MRKAIGFLSVAMMGWLLTSATVVGHEDVASVAPVFELSNGWMMDCTIRINFTLDDGTRFEGDLTFVGIPWWECVAIKVGNFLSKIF